MKLQNKDLHYLGHRQRLRKRFCCDSKNILDYELIEMLLFYVFQQKDTKPLAKNLLDHFGSLRELIFADRVNLKKTDGIGESSINLIALMREIFNRMQFEELINSTSIVTISNVTEYYKKILRNLKKEQLRIMFLDNGNKLITEELIQEGTINSAAIYPREIIQKALDYGSSAIIMVHNHPSGNPNPSQQDIVFTKTIEEVSRKLDLTLLDHVVIGKLKTVSFKELGIL